MAKARKSVGKYVVDGVRIFPDGRQVCTETKRGREIYLARTIYLYVRQEGLCAICGKWMHPYDASFEHEAGRGSGGSHRDDRTQFPDGRDMNAALCVKCNGEKGSRRFHWSHGRFIPAVYLSYEDWQAAEAA